MQVVCQQVGVDGLLIRPKEKSDRISHNKAIRKEIQKYGRRIRLCLRRSFPPV